MFKSNTFKKNIKNAFLITPNRIAVMGILLALLITLKYALGFIPGIEVVSFVFIIFGIFLPTLDLALMIICFNLLIIAIYGFGSWWFMYWIIWPVDAFVSKLISKKTTNKYVFGLWGFIAGASVGFWYFWSDALFFDWTFARLNIITAIPINAIEGLTTMICIITIGPSLAKVFEKYSVKFWNNDKAFLFKKNKRPKLNIFVTTILSLVSLSGVITLYVKNDVFFAWKNRESQQYYNSESLVVPKGEKPEISYDPSNPNSLDGTRTLPSKFGSYWGGEGHSVIPNSDYNEILKAMHRKSGAQAAIVIISNGKFETELIDWKFTKDTKILNLLKHLKRFEFNFHSVGGNLGDFINSFKYKNPKNKIQEGNQHGKAETKNYGDYYPLYYKNHKFANLGVSNMKIKENDVIEITYDHNA